MIKPLMRDKRRFERELSRRRVPLEQRLLPFLVIAVIAGAFGGLYLRRQDLRDTYDRWQKGPIPDAVSWADVRAGGPTGTIIPAVVPSDLATFDGSAAAEVKRGGTAIVDSPVVKAPTTPPPPSAETPKPVPLPPSINLKVPFIPQAPKQVWDAIHEDACEEASALMVQAYLNGEKTVSVDEAERRIQEVVAYEIQTLGFFESTDAETVAKIMREHLGIPGAKAVVLASAGQIRQQLAAGKPVILPADGKALKNPNFRRGGPVYHMVVVKGYTDAKFITNDPGTRKGADYVYDQKLLLDAVADWIGGGVDRNKKMMVVIE